MELSGREANEAGLECWIGTCTVGDKGLDDLKMGLSGRARFEWEATFPFNGTL